ncbi:DUF1330 domain-containing protein [Bradyrhizobium guangzhouense]|nr:DUF1330 domain-containing protein [Bradyrhizobium guangzhouense]
MTLTRTLTSSLAALAGLGAAAVHGLHAEGNAPAYVINEISVSDPAGFASYATQEGALIDKFGGRFLSRGGKTAVVAGELPKRVTIYVFDSLERAQAWRDAPEQKQLVAIRDKASSFRSFIVEGCGACKPPTG